MSYIEHAYPISTSPNEGANKTITATAGLPSFKEGCTAGPPISAYASPKIEIKTGGGGTAGNKQFNANDGTNLVGSGGE